MRQRQPVLLFTHQRPVQLQKRRNCSASHSLPCRLSAYKCPHWNTERTGTQILDRTTTLTCACTPGQRLQRPLPGGNQAPSETVNLKLYLNHAKWTDVPVHLLMQLSDFFRCEAERGVIAVLARTVNRFAHPKFVLVDYEALSIPLLLTDCPSISMRLPL